MTAVKICGITRRQDARVAAESGARYIGAVMVAESPRNVDPDQALHFARGLAPDLVMVVADEGTSTIADWARRCSAKVVQLHGRETRERALEIAEAGPWAVWKAIRARTADQVWAAIEGYADAVQGIVVDGWHPSRVGGTGVRVRWDELPGLRDTMPADRLFVAAGGLEPESVGEVVSAVRPHVVDVSSGVERAPGEKDPEKVRRFIQAATVV